MRPTGLRSASLIDDKPGCSMGGDGAGPVDAGQRRHPPLQQALGVTDTNGKEKTLVCASVLTSVNSTQLLSKMHILYLGLTTSSTHYTGLAGSPPWP